MQSNVIYVEQGTEEWHELRIGRATASRFKDVMTTIKSGESAATKNYRAELVAERLTGARVDNFKSAAMQWGNDYEDTARTMYELKSGNSVETCGFFAHDTLMAGASPDGLIGSDGLVEIKCPLTATHIETLRRQAVPYQYYWQVMGQMWITGRQWCDFVSYDPRLPENAQYVCIRVLRDKIAIEKLQMEVENFLESVDLEVNFIKNYKPNKESLDG